MRQPTGPQDYKTILLSSLFILLFGTCVRAQNFTSYFTGNATDFDTTGQSGVCLMGGASEDDNAMRWFLRRANGGDVVVLRTSGSDGYNDYMFNELGVPVNSVETIVFHAGAAAGAMEVREALEGAEAIWFAGGNQATYVDYWQNTAVDSLINAGIRDRGVVVGGTSAGMAILGGVRFTAENGTITSEEALADPEDPRITLDTSRFIHNYYLESYLTDTHFDAPDRKGRMLTFMARVGKYYDGYLGGIACDEYTAVCINANGDADVYGDSEEDDYAYFMRSICDVPEDYISANFDNGLTWHYGEGNLGGLLSQRIKGNEEGAFAGGILSPPAPEAGPSQVWSAREGVFSSTPSPSTLCVISTRVPPEAINLKLFPNPSDHSLRVTTAERVNDFRITDATGRTIISGQPNTQRFDADVTSLPPGAYFLTLTGDDWQTSARFMVIH